MLYSFEQFKHMKYLTTVKVATRNKKSIRSLHNYIITSLQIINAAARATAEVTYLYHGLVSLSVPQQLSTMRAGASSLIQARWQERKKLWLSLQLLKNDTLWQRNVKKENVYFESLFPIWICVIKNVSTGCF